MGRLFDCVLALSTQTYQIFDQTLAQEENIPCFVKLASNDFSLMKHQKLTSFNPTLISLSLKLASTDDSKAKKLAQRIGKFTANNVNSAPQIACAELNHLLTDLDTGKKRLEYLQLARQKPKGIPTYAPLIDKDFLIAGHYKQRQKTDEKVMRAKVKRADKEAQREVKKDTMVIM